MTYAELIGCNGNVSDNEIIKMINEGKDFKIGGSVVHRATISEKGVSGYFFEPTPT